MPGEAEISESRKGFCVYIGDRVYVTPVRIVQLLMDGKQKKGPVFEKRG